MTKPKGRGEPPDANDAARPDEARPKGVRPSAGHQIDPSVRKAIGNRLRAYYDEVAREPVPDRFVDLLKRLDSDDSSKH